MVLLNHSLSYLSKTVAVKALYSAVNTYQHLKIRKIPSNECPVFYIKTGHLNYFSLSSRSISSTLSLNL